MPGPRIAIFGAGAIGGYLGAKLTAAGFAPTLIARGPHLEAMAARGLTIIEEGRELTVEPRCTDDPRAAGPQDYIIITLKAPSVPAILDLLPPMMDAATAVVTAVNGIPWWYFHGLEGPFEDHRLASVDPGSAQWQGITPERAVGCVVYPACELVEPGVIRHLEGDRLTLGEPTGEATERVRVLSNVLKEAGLKAPVRGQIRNEIWVKLWGNLCFNPISVLTQATLDVITGDPGTRAIARDMMAEAQAIGEALGVRFGVDIDRRIEGAAAVGAHRTSMLQDLERGRTMEIDALLTVVQELGELVRLPTPTIDLVLALVQQRGRVAGTYQGPGSASP